MRSVSFGFADTLTNTGMKVGSFLFGLFKIFKNVLQDKEVTQYFLRHTFATTSTQYVRPDIVDTWMGDSSERLVCRVYTHFPDKFMRDQMDLVQFVF